MSFTEDQRNASIEDLVALRTRHLSSAIEELKVMLAALRDDLIRVRTNNGALAKEMVRLREREEMLVVALVRWKMEMEMDEGDVPHYVCEALATPDVPLEKS